MLIWQVLWLKDNVWLVIAQNRGYRDDGKYWSWNMVPTCERCASEMTPHQQLPPQQISKCQVTNWKNQTDSCLASKCWGWWLVWKQSIINEKFNYLLASWAEWWLLTHLALLFPSLCPTDTDAECIWLAAPSLSGQAQSVYRLSSYVNKTENKRRNYFPKKQSNKKTSTAVNCKTSHYIRAVITKPNKAN